MRATGLTCGVITGAYRLPCPTVTGSIRRDIVLIEQCIGAGAIAISDHYGSQPDLGVISDAASDCRVGGILAGKAGVMYCHIGNGPDLLGPLWRVVKETQVPIQTFLPTHMERSEALINDGANWVKAGGYVDFTCRTLKVFFLSRCVCLSVAFSLSLSLFPASVSARHNRRVFSPFCKSYPQHPLVV